jgi:hypothetical protein
MMTLKTGIHIHVWKILSFTAVSFCKFPLKSNSNFTFKLPLGGPRRRREDNIKMGLVEIGFGIWRSGLDLYD